MAEKQVQVKNQKEVKELTTNVSNVAEAAAKSGGEADVTQIIDLKESDDGTREMLVVTSAKVVRPPAPGSCA